MEAATLQDLYPVQAVQHSAHPVPYHALPAQLLAHPAPYPALPVLLVDIAAADAHQAVVAATAAADHPVAVADAAAAVHPAVVEDVAASRGLTLRFSINSVNF